MRDQTSIEMCSEILIIIWFVRILESPLFHTFSRSHRNSFSFASIAIFQSALLSFVLVALSLGECTRDACVHAMYDWFEKKVYYVIAIAIVIKDRQVRVSCICFHLINHMKNVEIYNFRYVILFQPSQCFFERSCKKTTIWSISIFKIIK